MPRNVYSEINFHITWHTKLNAQIIATEHEHDLYHYIHHRAVQSPGVFVHEVGGMPDHIHLAVSVPPTLLMSTWIGELKGVSSYFFNRQKNRPSTLLDWQVGYGIVSFGTADLEWVINYIKNQKQHHGAGTFFHRLEQITNLD